MSTQKIILYTSGFIALCCLCYGPMTKELVNPSISGAISRGRTINTALISYYGQHKAYPENLQQLVEAEIIEAEYLILDDLIELYYVNGWNLGDEDKIFFYTSPYDPDYKYGKNMTIVGLVGGNVFRLHKDELAKRLRKEALILKTNKL